MATGRATGDVTLTVDGDALKGTWADGVLTGVAEGDDKVKIAWTHKASGSTGHALLTVGKDGAELKGTWGFDEATEGEGDWSLEQTKRVPLKKAKPEAKPKGKPKAKPAPKKD